MGEQHLRDSGFMRGWSCPAHHLISWEMEAREMKNVGHGGSFGGQWEGLGEVPCDEMSLLL